MKKTKIERAIENFEIALKITLNVQEQDISNHITIADGWVALEALREALKRVEGCKVCEYEIEPFDLFINDKETRTLTYYPGYRPKNCPECGRRLGEEAQDDQTGSP